MLSRLNKFSPVTTYAFRSMSLALHVPTDEHGRTPLHLQLPTFKTVEQFHDYVATHGYDHVKRELHTVSNRGFLPISRLLYQSDVLDECLKFYNPNDGMLPLYTTSEAEPNADQEHYEDYRDLFNTANTIINYTRNRMHRSPHPLWMDARSAAAKEIINNEAQIQFALSLSINASEQHKNYAFRFANLCELQGSGSSQAFAYVGLKAFAQFSTLGAKEASVYTVGHTDPHYFLIINDAHDPRYAVVCDPWQGQVYTCTDITSKCRIPKALGGNPSNTVLVFFNKVYHSLTQLHQTPTRAGELASSVRNPLSFFKEVYRDAQITRDKQRLRDAPQSLTHKQ